MGKPSDPMEEPKRNVRIVGLQIFALIAFVLFSARLWRLQVVRSEEYAVIADENRFRLASVPAPRGVIYDRKGRMLVRNVPSYTISIVPAALPELQRDREIVLSRLSELLEIPVSSTSASVTPMSVGMGIEEMLANSPGGAHSPVPIKANVDKQIAFLIDEEHLYLPGVMIEITPLRHYPAGAVTSQVLGYVGRIPAERVDQYIGAPGQDYELNDLVGLMGVEATLEEELRGDKGLKHVEVNAYEREVRVLSQDPPQPGHNVVLTLDLDLQESAEAALREGMYRVGSTAGSVVALNPQTGEVLAMVSVPAYDNNLFARGITSEELDWLSNNPERPLVNHAISGQYPPGSAFKIVPAAAGLEEEVIDLQTRLSCRGVLWLPNQFFPDDPDKAQRFVCWNEWGHGSLNVIGGLAQSCDIYFYQVGGGFESFRGLGIERLGAYARTFGFGEETGIALPGESAGLVPDDRWKRVNYGESWVTGDTYNAVIGQGFVLVTPLQLVNAAAAVANGGTLYRPQILYQVFDDEGYVVRGFTPEVIRQVPVSEENIQIVQQGMRAAVTEGTAHRVNLAEVAVAGKTGTAEYQGPRDADGNLPTHAWFIAYAPYEHPEIALMVFVSGGHEGAKVAVPIAAKILRSYFGIPQPVGEDIVAPPPGD